jgi:hypothetical protein
MAYFPAAFRRRRWGTAQQSGESVPVRTFDDWGEPPPGYCEADLVELAAVSDGHGQPPGAGH